MDSHLSDGAVVPPAGPDASARVRRYGVATRLWHWAFAALFLCLLATGLTNFWPEAKALQAGGERLFAWTHVVVGFAFVGALPLLGLLLLLRSRDFRADLAAAHRVRTEDLVWVQEQGVRLAGGDARPPPPGKFNGGQKLNAWAVAALTAGLAGSGVVLGVHWVDRDRLDLGFVESVFPWHTALALVAAVLVAGHVALAVLVPGTRGALGGMLHGRVSAAWAQRHHPRWRPPDGDAR